MKMNGKETDEKYMRRALQLAASGAGHVSPNPMVGAVIVAGGRVIGEGYHRRCGGPHAEMEAVRSVREADRPLIAGATVYVTLEPCSHYGKTPPCARMLVEKHVGRVVVGASDPNPLVAGKGVAMLREAGIEVSEGVLEEECVEINRRFMTAFTKRRPWIQLKWAQSADGFIGGLDTEGKPVPIWLSNPLTKVLMHRERSMADAILVGTNTVISDNPRLTNRLWPGAQPVKMTFASERLPKDARILGQSPLLIPRGMELEEALRWLREEHGVTSLMVEGGAETLRRFIEKGLFDEVRIERSALVAGKGIPAPEFNPRGLRPVRREVWRGNVIEVWRR